MCGVRTEEVSWSASFSGFDAGDLIGARPVTNDFCFQIRQTWALQRNAPVRTESSNPRAATVNPRAATVNPRAATVNPRAATVNPVGALRAGKGRKCSGAKGPPGAGRFSRSQSVTCFPPLPKRLSTAFEKMKKSHHCKRNRLAQTRSNKHGKPATTREPASSSKWTGTSRASFISEGKYDEAKDAISHSAGREADTLLACLNHRPRAEVETDVAKSKASVLAIRYPEDRYGMAGTFAFCGLEERALRMLRLVVEGNFLAYPAMDRSPMLANIRGTPEFVSIRALAIQNKTTLSPIAPNGSSRAPSGKCIALRQALQSPRIIAPQPPHRRGKE